MPEFVIVENAWKYSCLYDDERETDYLESSNLLTKNNTKIGIILSK